MATQKHPLAGLFNEKRKQAQDFNRDLVTRASARQGGAWGTYVQETLPASQTDMGRLASSLSTVSGVLSQLSQFNLAKDLELQKGRQIEHGIRMQGLKQLELEENIATAGLRGQELDERIIQQEMATEEARTKAADAEWENEWAQLSPAQQEEHIKQAGIEAKAAAAERDKAEADIDAAVGSTYRRGDHPLGAVRAERRMGASMAHDYAEFFRQRLSELAKEIRESGAPKTLSSEIAEDTVRGILDEYLAEKEIDPDSEVGRGFMMAVSGLNAKSMPPAAQTLLDEAERLGDINLQGAFEGMDLSPPSLPTLSSESGMYENEAFESATQDALMEQVLDLTEEQKQEVNAALVDEGLSLDKLYEAWPAVDKRDMMRGLELVEAVKEGDNYEIPNILDHPAVKELQGKTSAEKLKFLNGKHGEIGVGKEGFVGLQQIMGANEQSAKKYQMILMELSEVLVVDGKLLKDHMEFDTMLAVAEDTVEKAIAGQAKKEQTLGEKAFKDTTDPVARAIWELSTKDATDALNRLRLGPELPDRETVIEIFPELEDTVKDVPENEWFNYIEYIRKSGERVLENREVGWSAFLRRHLPTYVKKNERVGATGILLELKSGPNMTEDGKNKIESYLEFAQGQGAPVQGHQMTLSVRGLERLEDETGAISQYTENLNNLFDRIREQGGGAYMKTDEGAKEVKEGLKEIDDELRNALRASILGISEESIKGEESLQTTIQNIEEAAIAASEGELEKSQKLQGADTDAMPAVSEGIRQGASSLQAAEEAGGWENIWRMPPAELVRDTGKGWYQSDTLVLKKMNELPVKLDEAKDVLDDNAPIDLAQSQDYLFAFAAAENAYKKDCLPFFELTDPDESEFGGVDFHVTPIIPILPPIGRKAHPDSEFGMMRRRIGHGGHSLGDVAKERGASVAKTLLADKHLPSIQQPRVALTSLADKVHGKDMQIVSSEKGILREYNQQMDELEMRVRRKNSVSVEGGMRRVAELVLGQETTGGNYIAHEGEKWLGQDTSLFQKQFDKASRDSEGELRDSTRWNTYRRNVTLDENHFSTYRPVIKGLPLEDTSIASVASATGASEETLKKIATAYGFETTQGFLDDQYSHPYYKALGFVSGRLIAQHLDVGEDVVSDGYGLSTLQVGVTAPPPLTGPPEPEFTPEPVAPIASPVDPPLTGDPDATTGGTGIAGGALTAEPDPSPVSPPPEVAPTDPSAPPIDPNLPPAPIEPIPSPKVPEPPKAPAPPKAIPVPEITGTPIKWQRTGKGATATITAETRKNITVIPSNRSSAAFRTGAAKSENVVSTDFNDAKDAKGRQVGKGIEVVLAGNASSAQIEASKVYVKLLDQFMRNGGVKDNPIREGKGRKASRGEQIPGLWFKADVTKNKPRMMYTEPFFAAHTSARKAIEKNPKEYARILIEAFGGLPGVVMIPPHTNTDPGAVTPDGKMTEQAWSKKYVIPYLQELLAETTQT